MRLVFQHVSRFWVVCFDIFFANWLDYRVMNDFHDTFSFSKPQLRLLGAAGVGSDLIGTGLVIETALTCTKVAAQRWPESGLVAWSEAAGKVRKSLRNASSGSEAAPMFARPHPEPEIFRTLASWPAVQSDAAFLQTIVAVLGRAWVIHAQRAQLIPDALARGLRILQYTFLERGKRSSDWRRLSCANLTDLNSVRQLSIELRPNSVTHEFLKSLEFILFNDVTPYLDETVATEINDPDDSVQQQFTPSRDANNSQLPETDPSKQQTDTGRALDTRRVAARLSAADYAPALAKLGIDHRDHLLLDDLTPITSHLAAELTHGTRLSQGYAAFHLICLLLSTSDLYALSVRLDEHPDHIWLDIESGVWCWDFAPYRYAGKSRPADYEGAEAVIIPMPLQLTKFLQSHFRKDHHSDVESLICSIQGVDHFDLDTARQFLRGLGNQSHPPYRARWSNSLAPATLQITGSDMFTAYATAQFAAVAPSALFYYAPTWQSVYDRIEQVFARLKLGPACRPFDSSSRVGAAKIPTFETIRRGWTELVASCSTIETQLKAAHDRNAVASLTNELMNHLAAAFVVQSAHRCQRFDKLTHGALNSMLEMLVIEDKVILDEAARAHPRLIGKTEQLAAIITSAFRCSQSAAAVLGLPAAESDTPVFMNVGPEPSSPLVPVKSNRVAQIIGEFFDDAPDNFGRTLWITALDTCGIDRWLIRTLSGHVRDVSRVTGPFFDMPPAHAARQLRQAMEEVGQGIFGDQRLIATPTESIRLFPRQTTAPYSISALQSKVSPQLILEPIDLGTLCGAAVASRVREALRTGAATDLSIHTNLLLHLVFVDLLDGEEVALPAVLRPEKHLSNQSPRPGIRWRRSYFVHDFWAPLTTESALLYLKVEPSEFKMEFLEQELREFIVRATGLDAKEDDVFSDLFAWARAYKRIFFPPTLLASASRHVESPCLNEGSLFRLWRREKSEIDHSILQRPNKRRTQTGMSQDIENLSSIINKYGDSRKRLGERRKRAIDAMAAIKDRGDAWSPVGSFLMEWAVEELCRSRDNVVGRYEVSSLSTYLSRLKVGFHDAHEDPRDWSDSDWIAFLEKVERAYGDKNYRLGDHLSDDTKNAIGALMRSLQRRSYRISRELWTQINGRDDFTAPADSASATLFTDEDLMVVDKVIESTLRDYPPNLLRCRFRLTGGRFIPLRSGDFANLKRTSITPAGGVVIERSGFNSIKNQQSIRVWQLDSTQINRLQSIATTLSAYVTAGDLLLRGTGHGSDNEEDLSASATLNWTLKFVTGDPKARMHSLRATTLQSLAWPQWQSIASQFLNLDLLARDLNTWTTDRSNAWLSTARAAGAAGHSGISSALHSYLAGWPLVHALHATSLCSELPMSGPYVETLGLSYTAMRQARSRANRQALSSFTLDDWLQQQLRARLKHDHQQPNTKNPTVLPNERTTPDAKYAANMPESEVIDDASSLRYLVRRALGEPQGKVQNHLVLGSSACQRLEMFNLSESLIAECNRRARNGAKSRAIQSQLTLIDSTLGSDLVDWVLGLSQHQFACAFYAFVWFVPTTEQHDWTIPEWEELADSLPKQLAIRLHRGKAHLTSDEVRFVAKANLSIKPERDLGQHHRATLLLRVDPDNRVQSTRLSSVLQLLLLARSALSTGGRHA